MQLDLETKWQSITEIIGQNEEQIAKYQELEHQIAMNKWLLEAYTSIATGNYEFKDIFNREISIARRNLQKLEINYNENKIEYEKKRLIKQNKGLEQFLIQYFGTSTPDFIRKKEMPAEMPAETVAQASAEPAEQVLMPEMQQEENIPEIPAEPLEMPEAAAAQSEAGGEQPPGGEQKTEPVQEQSKDKLKPGKSKKKSKRR